MSRKDGSSRQRVLVIGGGFTGLSAAWQLARDGVDVTVLEREAELGGLAAGFPVDSGQTLERFYHHWFTNDHHVMDLIRELGAQDQVLLRPTRTGVYHARRMFRLSTPLDLLRFSALSPFDRLRLGWLALRARTLKDWRALEQITAAQWLRELAGEQVYRVVWEPLLRGKFGALAEEVSAVWMWNKLKLRGGSRGRGGEELLAYFRGGFPALVQRLRQDIERAGGRVLTGVAAESLEVTGGQVCGVITSRGPVPCAAVIATTALPLVADLLVGLMPADYLQRLREVRYLANVCLILELDRSLSDTYWLNVNDPSFPFVGIVEHTNFEPAASYGGRHIAYLSRYLLQSDAFYRLDANEMLQYCLPFLQRIFPDFQPEWVKRHYLWRARFAQPVVTRGYASTVPDVKTPLKGLYLASMAQIYPEDRGTNYAIRDGRCVARLVRSELNAALEDSSAIDVSMEGQPA